MVVSHLGSGSEQASGIVLSTVTTAQILHTGLPSPPLTSYQYMALILGGEAILKGGFLGIIYSLQGHTETVGLLLI
jgi:hypothetical protein